MRSSKSRSRGNKNRSRQSNNGNNQNRVFDSSGPEGKVRGTPQQIIDKYNQLARDAQLSNDRVAVENFQQHAEHYTRMLAEAMREAEVKREQQEALREQQETQNRERQQQRDSERVERQERDAARDKERKAEQGVQAAVETVETVETIDPASAPQPDMAAAPADDNGLVDTPESKPAPRKRTRKPKSSPLQQAETPDAPDAAE